ncbi:MAG: calcium-binding protein [Pseudomonadota bacterium]
MRDLAITLSGEDGDRIDFTQAGPPIFTPLAGGVESGGPGLNGLGTYIRTLGNSSLSAFGPGFPPPPDPDNLDVVTQEWLNAAAGTPAQTITVANGDLGLVAVLTFPGGGALAANQLTALSNEAFFAGRETVTVAPSPSAQTVIMDLGAGADQFVGATLGRSVVDGGVGNDQLVGGVGGDRLRGEKGNDFIGGNGGRDKLYGGAGRDELFGDAVPGTRSQQTGADLIRGGSGADKASGGGGGDRIFGDGGGDTLKGEGESDRLFGGAGNDKLFGGAGDDIARGGGGRDRIEGGKGEDTLDGDGADDRLFGGKGEDVLRGGAGDDVLFGGAGGDAMLGGKGDDLIFGGSGDDVVSTSKGVDAIQLGAGADTLAIDPRGGLGRTLVTDFGRQDSLLLPDVGGTPFELLEEIATDTSKGVRLDISNRQFVLLEGWSLDDFSAGQVDFIPD